MHMSHNSIGSDLSLRKEKIEVNLFSEGHTLRFVD